MAGQLNGAKNSISPKYPNFSFHHFDVKDQLHNPSGSKTMADYRLPLEDDSIDLVILWPVFTHMFHEDIVYYLKEFQRVMKRSGKVMASVFIYDDEVLDSARATNLTPYSLRFEYAFGDGCLINDPKHPAGAVAYTSDALSRMAVEGGLEIHRIHLGSWSGLHKNGYVQDMIILKRARWLESFYS